MGKKNKNKISGSVKTAMKTEKKLSAKRKKELAALGEDDIEKVIAEIEKEEAKRQKVVEALVEQPSRRVNFTLTSHPFKEELIMLGGEFHDGQKTTVYGDMFFYNLNKNTWTVVKAPGAPPPRCGHQAVALPSNKGELWVFGGEFSSPSESQFYHYKDLWVFHIGEKKWEKITAAGGPSSRSGHRMVAGKKKLIVFGGFHDNLREFKYFNDLSIFDLTTYQWKKIILSGSIPAPRSGCIVLPAADNKILVYGGYSKERVKKDVDQGQVHSDMFVLAPEKHDDSGLKWKSVLVKQSGVRVSPRCSSSAILVQPGLAYIFGGVFDDEDDDEELHGTFYNDLLALDLEKHQWKVVNVCPEKEKVGKRRRKKDGDDDDDDDDGDQNEDEEGKEKDSMQVDNPTVVTSDDGIFTVTVGPSSAASSTVNPSRGDVQTFTPSPRINPGLAVKNSTLYLYGGMFENGDHQYTLNDFYSLDINKLNEWHTIVKDDLSDQVWIESDSSDSDDSNSESEGSDDDANDDSDGKMDVN